MNKRDRVFVAALALLIAAVMTAFGQSVPNDRISPAKHPNLAEAQQLIRQAYAKIQAAQQANRDELGGHAQKAEELLDQASHELEMAAGTSNQNHH